jgi:TolB-like protein
MRAIGQALSARFLIDGSVRKSGNRVRITAQLVQTDNGVGVWTNMKGIESFVHHVAFIYGQRVAMAASRAT